ncbi:MAG: metal-dependent hydrolase [Planctomycetes bacterium]|nr:metal-dependent hydrolase [Planctomycetota bacterium]
MKIPEHLALSYLLAQFGVAQEFGAAGTGLVLLAGMLPDLDGLSILGGWRCHRTYHRVLGHGLLVTLFGALLLALVGAWALGQSGVFLTLWAWLHLSLLAHLATDCLFYSWPVQLLWPFSTWGVGFGLVAWNDLVPTLILYAAAALALAWPVATTLAAVGGVALLGLYLGWRAWRPRPHRGWGGWLTGGWARRSPRYWRWLTGDFIT